MIVVSIRELEVWSLSVEEIFLVDPFNRLGSNDLLLKIDKKIKNYNLCIESDYLLK